MLRAIALLAGLAVALDGNDSGGVWKRTGAKVEFLIVKDGKGVRFAGGVPQVMTGDELGAIRVADNGKSMALEGDRWERQDPLSGEIGMLGFEQRRELEKASGEEADRLRGAVACAFNDIAGAERAYQPILRGKSKYRDEARGKLAQLYWRNGMTKKAVEYYPFVQRFFFRQLAKYPEIKVTRRGLTRVQATRDGNGHLLLPLTVAGQDARYLMDTGGNKTIIRVSEARRLGLKLESPHIRMENGITKFDAHLAIVPVLTVGEMQLENVPVWVTPDDRLDWLGVLGIDVLLQWETLRWSPDNWVEIGFTGEPKDIVKANLCFRHLEVFAEAEAYGEKNLALFLDTGNPSTEMYTRFAARFVDVVAGSKLSPEPYVWDGMGARREFREIRVPEILLSIAGHEVTLRNKGLLLERRPGQNERHGILGMDLLDSAHRVTLDFRAMKLTLE